ECCSVSHYCRGTGNRRTRLKEIRRTVALIGRGTPVWIASHDNASIGHQEGSGVIPTHIFHVGSDLKTRRGIFWIEYLGRSTVRQGLDTANYERAPIR